MSSLHLFHGGESDCPASSSIRKSDHVGVSPNVTELLAADRDTSISPMHPIVGQGGQLRTRQEAAAASTLPFDQPLRFNTQFSTHTVAGKILVIAVDMGAWFCTDDLGFVLFTHLADGMSPWDAFLSVVADQPTRDPTVALRALGSLLMEMHRMGILSADLTLVRKEYVTPTLLLYLTKRCNLYCAHCYKEAGPTLDQLVTRELSTAEIGQLLRQYSEITPEGNITLTGGEPLLRTDVYDIVELAKRLGHHICLFTNGTLLKHDNLKRLAPWLDEIQISLDGATAAGNDAIRGEGTYARIWRGIELVAQTPITLDVAITITPRNVRDLLDHSELLAKRLGPISCNVRFAVVKPEGRAQNVFEHVTRASLQTAAEQLVEEVANYRVKRGPLNPQKRFNCGFGPGFHVDWEGTVYPCREYPRFRVGNIRDTPLSDIYPQLLESYLSSCVDRIHYCHECDLRYICTGGCRIENLLQNGDLLKPRCSEEQRHEIYRLMTFA